MTRLLLIMPASGFGTEEGRRLSAVLPLLQRLSEVGGFDPVVSRDAGERLPAPASCGWSGELRTDEIATLTVVDRRIASVA